MPAAAGEKVDIAGDGALAAPAGLACWMFRLLLLYLGDRSTCARFRGVAWFAMLPAHPHSLAGGEATTSPCRVDKAGNVGIGTCAESHTWVDWLLAAGTDG